MELVRNYRIVPKKAGAIVVYKQFWPTQEKDPIFAPPLLVYTDLGNTGKRRNIETAQRIFNKYLQGFQEVYEEATEKVSFESKYNIRVASLAGIVVLKLIAWDDRPEIRSDDIVDVAIIINHYFELEENLIYDQHVDLFTKDIYDLKILSAA